MDEHQHLLDRSTNKWNGKSNR